ncbi:MAG: LysM peptidoglycan-binding domain-containing protein [Candidatus Edwardsbacteria bacterium]
MNRKKILLGVLLTLSMILSAWVVGQEGGEKVHRVISGDTLWDLAGTYLGNPFSWPLIWQANKEKIEDPHWIYPGQEFVIPPAVPMVAEEEVVEKPQEKVEEIPPEEVEIITPPPPVKPEKAEKISVVRRPLPVVAQDLAFRAGYIAEEKRFEGGYIIASQELYPKKANFITNELVSINRGTRENVKPKDKFAVFNLGRQVKHPKTKKLLGRLVEILGLLEVTAVQEKSSTAKIIKSFYPINFNDWIMPYEEIFIAKDVSPLPTTVLLEGYLVETKEKDKVITTHDIAYIDKGLASGIMPGDVFEIYHQGEKVKNLEKKEEIQLPPQIVGRLQVLSVRNNTAAVYICNSKVTEIKVGDPIRLIKKIPGTLPKTEEIIEEK